MRIVPSIPLIDLASTAAPAPWYKGQLKDKLLDLSPGTPVWFKLNTEKPLASGPSYWVFEPKTKAIRHIVADLGDVVLQGERLKTGWKIANEDETKALLRAFGPLVRDILSSPAWKQAGKPDNRKDKQFRLDYSKQHDSGDT